MNAQNLMRALMLPHRQPCSWGELRQCPITRYQCWGSHNHPSAPLYVSRRLSTLQPTRQHMPRLAPPDLHLPGGSGSCTHQKSPHLLSVLSGYCTRHHCMILRNSQCTNIPTNRYSPLTWKGLDPAWQFLQQPWLAGPDSPCPPHTCSSQTPRPSASPTESQLPTHQLPMSPGMLAPAGHSSSQTGCLQTFLCIKS